MNAQSPSIYAISYTVRVECWELKETMNRIQIILKKKWPILCQIYKSLHFVCKTLLNSFNERAVSLVCIMNYTSGSKFYKIVSWWCIVTYLPYFIFVGLRIIYKWWQHFLVHGMTGTFNVLWNFHFREYVQFLPLWPWIWSSWLTIGLVLAHSDMWVSYGYSGFLSGWCHS